MIEKLLFVSLCVQKYAHATILGERQEAQILKFNAPPLHT